MKYLVSIISIIFLCSCGIGLKQHPISTNIVFYEGINALSNGDTTKAIKFFKQTESNYDDQDMVIESQIFLIWLYYKTNQLDSAYAIANSFLKFYPYSEYVLWVEYIRSVINYEQIPDSRRDISFAENDLILFNDFIKKYPNTRYVKDIEFRKIFVNQILANRVMDIGRYYLKQQAYLAAMPRFQAIINNYSKTIFVPEALYQSIYISIVLGINDEAIRNYKVLLFNYPNNIWTKKAIQIIRKNKININ